MSNEKWTAYDWGLNNASVGAYDEYEERLMNGIDKRMRRRIRK